MVQTYPHFFEGSRWATVLRVFHWHPFFAAIVQRTVPAILPPGTNSFMLNTHSRFGRLRRGLAHLKCGRLIAYPFLRCRDSKTAVACS